MKIKSYEITFNKSFNAQAVANVDAQIRELLNEHAPTHDTSDRETFSQQMNNLNDGLSQQGDYTISEMYIVRKAYLKRRMLNEGASVNSVIHYGRVFDSVISRALGNKARTLSKVEAKDYDEHLVDLRALKHNNGIFFTPQTKDGSQWLPTKMEDIAFIDDDEAGEWGLGDEPYAGTSFLDSI